ncbi:MAG: hypothetical protein M3Y87_01530 [Myxococcota bacterium]|nr:hypothetical protein [Myxococcota bacterium]
MTASAISDEDVASRLLHALKPLADYLLRSAAAAPAERAALNAGMAEVARRTRDLARRLREHHGDGSLNGARAVLDSLEIGFRSAEIVALAREFAAILTDPGFLASAKDLAVATTDHTLDGARLLGLAASDDLTQARGDLLGAVAEVERAWAERAALANELLAFAEGIDASGIELGGAAQSIENLTATHAAMAALRERARELGAPVFWGEPILDD